MPTLADLLKAVSTLEVSGPTDMPVEGLSVDTRKLKAGELFFAVPGSKTDGNLHVHEAVQKGASAIVSELRTPSAPLLIGPTWVRVGDATAAMGRIADRFFGHPSRSMTIFGVTGTNGKTTTTYFLESIVAAAGGKPAVLGTVNYRLAGAFLEKAPNTTPIAADLQRWLARFRNEGATHVAMEVSSHALALKRVEEVEFDAAIFTNLGRDHLDFHRTPQDYFEAKARLFDILCRVSSSKKRRVAVLNADDPKSRELRTHIQDAETVFYGQAHPADLKAETIESTADRSRFVLSWRGCRLPAEIALVGSYNVDNALAAAAAALALGFTEDSVLAGLRSLKSVPGRLESVEAGQDFKVFVDYAHSPQALDAVLGHLRRLPHQRLLTVFGCGGDRDRTKRAPMGTAVCRGSDLAIVTSDNPRTEDPLGIIADIEAGLKEAGLKNYKINPNRAQAIEEAVGLAKTDDIVLIAGKGHEDTQILRTGTIPFDDRLVARAILALRMKTKSAP